MASQPANHSEFVVERPPTLAGFFEHAAPFLLENEAEHGLMLSIAALTTSGVPADAYWALVRNASNAVTAAALRTMSKMMLSREGAPGAMAALAAELRQANYASIIGPWPSLESFAKAAGGSWTPTHHHVLYECRGVRQTARIHGRRRLATAVERDLLADWIQAFSDEAIGDGATRQAAEATADRHLRDRSMWLWCIEETPVACTAAVGRTPHGIRLAAVYTPPSHRRHGYASALVASLTRELLESGREFVFLYADRGNPTANGVYQRIGFRVIAEAGELARV